MNTQQQQHNKDGERQAANPTNMPGSQHPRHHQPHQQQQEQQQRRQRQADEPNSSPRSMTQPRSIPQRMTFAGHAAAAQGLIGSDCSQGRGLVGRSITATALLQNPSARGASHRPFSIAARTGLQFPQQPRHNQSTSFDKQRLMDLLDMTLEIIQDDLVDSSTFSPKRQ